MVFITQQEKANQDMEDNSRFCAYLGEGPVSKELGIEAKGICCHTTYCLSHSGMPHPLQVLIPSVFYFAFRSPMHMRGHGSTSGDILQEALSLTETWS